MVIFQYAFLLKKDAINMQKGPKPDLKTGRTAQVTPFDIAAKVAIKGAIDQSNQVTLLGLARPLKVSLK